MAKTMADHAALLEPMVANEFEETGWTVEAKARTHFETIRWPSGPVCPHCGNADATRLYMIAANATAKIREGLRECQDCHGQFTVMTGTVMESSHLPLTKWAAAFRLLGGAKKGMSAHQLHRTLGVSYKTAWFLAMRVREAMRDANPTPMGGKGQIVESDETFVGGKPRRTRYPDFDAPAGSGKRYSKKYQKTAVQVLVERGGKKRARAIPLPDPFDGAVRRNVIENVARGTHLQTDQFKAYNSIERDIGGKHSSVDHSAGEYARRRGKLRIHSNTAESWNALLKRSIYGSFHHISREHLSRYCDEISFRWDRKDMDDTERTAAAIKAGEGKRLTYRRTGLSQQDGA